MSLKKYARELIGNLILLSYCARKNTKYKNYNNFTLLGDTWQSIFEVYFQSTDIMLNTYILYALVAALELTRRPQHTRERCITYLTILEKYFNCKLFLTKLRN